MLNNHHYCLSGSEKERKAVRQANRFSTRRDENLYKHKTSQDVSFEAIIDDDNLKLGDDVDINLLIKNKSKETKTVSAVIVTKVAFYNGVVARDLETLKEKVTLGAKKGNSVIARPHRIARVTYSSSEMSSCDVSLTFRICLCFDSILHG